MPATTRDWQRRGMRTFDAVIAVLVPSLLLVWLPHIDHADGVEYPLLILAGGLLLPSCGEVLGLYQPWRGRSLFTMLGVYSMGWLVAIILLSLFLVATQSVSIFSRGWMLLASVSVLTMGLVSRSLLYLHLRRIRSRGRNTKKVLLIGTPNNMARIQQRLESMPYLGYQVATTLSDDLEDNSTLITQVEQLASRSAFQREFDEIWLTYPLANGDSVKRLAATLMKVPVEIRYFPDLSDVRLLNYRATQVADMFSLDLNRSPLSGPTRLIKVLEDRLLGTILLILFSPVMLLTAAAIRWKMGTPVLFKQYRHGLNGKRFRIYKFRTMAPHTASSTQQATHNDLRITPLGAFLRRTSLDELPQLYNVLQGRMSLIGPRPHAMDHNEHYKELIDTYMQRHRVKPGMTGWAQVNGLRGITDDVALMQKRVEYDLYYIDNWTPAFDLKILAMTITKGFINTQP